MPSCNTYCLTWVSLTLDVGYLFMAAPAKHSHCSLPWMRGISQLPLLTLNVEQLLLALLHQHSSGSLDVGLLLSAAGHHFWVLVLEGLVGLHRTIQFQLFQHYWLAHRLGLLSY